MEKVEVNRRFDLIEVGCDEQGYRLYRVGDMHIDYSDGTTETFPKDPTVSN